MLLPYLFIGGSEIIFIVFVVVLIFGADKVPEIARGLAKAMKMIRNATNDIKTEITLSAEEELKKSGASDIKEEYQKVKEDIEEITGSVKRKNFWFDCNKDKRTPSKLSHTVNKPIKL